LNLLIGPPHRLHWTAIAELSIDNYTWAVTGRAAANSGEDYQIAQLIRTGCGLLKFPLMFFN